MTDNAGALSALDRILNRGGDADDVLRDVVGVLRERYEYVAIRFHEGSDVVEGPSAGTPDEAARILPIAFRGMHVAELRVSPGRGEDREFLERVRTIISPFCLVAWDTGGKRWSP